VEYVIPDRLSRRAALAVLALSAGMLALHALQASLGLQSMVGLDGWAARAAAIGATLVLVLGAVRTPAMRGVWLAFAAGVASSIVGDLHTLLVGHHQGARLAPIDQALGYAVYLLLLAGLVLLARQSARQLSRTLWFDAVLGAVSVASVGAAVLVPIIRSGTGGTVEITRSMVHPLAGLVLLTVLVASIALTGWRPGRSLVLIGAALLFLVVGDAAYLGHSAWLDVTRVAAFVLLAAAASIPPRPRRRRIDGWVTVVAPIALGSASIAVTTFDHFTRVNTGALILASITLALALVRLGLTFAEHLRVLERLRTDALVDSLTGLGNRRALMRDLEAALRTATPSAPMMLALFDLDGFKTFNDRFGHPAGDALLQRLGSELRASVPEPGVPYRLGGDEFCVLMPAYLADGVERARTALSEQGEGFEVRPSLGTALIGLEVHTSSDAMREADRRLYAHKHGRPGSARDQIGAVLLRALEARHGGIGHRLNRVAAVAAGVAERLGLEAGEVAEVVRAAELHDVGKVGIPESILNKPGPLDADEWAFMHRHTIIGQRILDAAPALARVGQLVRSSHEHWDGTGYPDALTGEEIPLGARILLVCDAYDSMTTDRAYREALSHEQAVAELVRCRGTQFDPVVVDAALPVLAELVGEAPASAA
jgi:diguanylate cyclase (GGDEF)-like protein